MTTGNVLSDVIDDTLCDLCDTMNGKYLPVVQSIEAMITWNVLSDVIVDTL